MSERYRGSVRSRLVRAMPRFIVIGGVGFVADGGLLTLLASGLGFDVYLSRLASFAFASFLTWWLNRVWTFSSTDVRRTREYVRYIAIQIVGALINLGVFVALIRHYPWMNEALIAPFAIGSAVAMVFNFIGCHYVVFTDDARSSGSPGRG